MHDTNLLQLINDDFAPAQQLLELLQTESLALHGRDMPLLEEILAHKQALIILLEQHGRKRSEILASLNLPTDRQGLSNWPASRALANNCSARAIS
jgi:flagella synthesis protein FlgN